MGIVGWVGIVVCEVGVAVDELLFWDYKVVKLFIVNIK